MWDFEKLGAFYLGGDLNDQQNGMFMLDSRDLTTHGVILGMTGSGKTGLGIGLIEEAAIDGVPMLVIDPKGDLGNLALTFPEMRPEDILPWLPDDEVRASGKSAQELAQMRAAGWRNGLASWQQTPDRIRLMHQGADVVIYTPGSTVGEPICVLSSWAAPGPAIMQDAELLGELVQGAVSSLLGLLNIDFDPLSSREFMFLSQIFMTAWNNQQNVDLPYLITSIQNPPFDKIGMMDLNSIYPAKDRFGLAMAINSLMASPAFQSWLTGVPLDVGQLLYRNGRPQIAVFSIAHLSDAERMFFVTLLANATLTWMRRQPGTSSLRALFYMDEVAGYLPPNGNPPSKKPIMTMFKQARAFGLGLVLASQNPVDFDYKALSNAGVWFVGRLQTPQDRAKVKANLVASLGSRADSMDLDQMLGGLQKRHFIAITPGCEPFEFETRWTLSFLRGPMTREDIKRARDMMKARGQVMPSEQTAPATSGFGLQGAEAHGSVAVSRADYQGGGASAAVPAGAALAGAGAAANAASNAASQSAAPTVLSADVPQCWIGPAPSGTKFYLPVLLGVAIVRYNNSKYGVVGERYCVRYIRVSKDDYTLLWSDSYGHDLSGSIKEFLRNTPEQGLVQTEAPAVLRNAKAYKGWSKEFVTWVYSNCPYVLYSYPPLKAVSLPDESENEFRNRLLQMAREQRDRNADAVKAKFAPKLTRLQERIQKAMIDKDNYERQAAATRNSSIFSFVGTAARLFTGRKLSALGSGSTALNQTSRARIQGQKAELAESKYQSLLEEEKQLKDEMQAALASVPDPSLVARDNLETITISPKKTDISVVYCGLGWWPVRPR